MFKQLLIVLLCFLPRGASAAERIVLVSVAPYVEIVEELTAKQVDVALIVPAGFSAHTYEPTPKQILKASKANLWFTIGEAFEERAIKALKAQNPEFVTVD